MKYIYIYKTSLLFLSRKEKKKKKQRTTTRRYPARACGDERSPIELRLTEEWPAPFI